MTGLSDRDRGMLDLERLWWENSGAKEHAIRERFDLSPVQYYSRINELIDTEAALAYDPIVVKKLQRLRTNRQRSRSARALGIDL